MRWLGPVRDTLDEGVGMTLEVRDVTLVKDGERRASPMVMSWEGIGLSMWLELALKPLNTSSTCEVILARI